MVEIGIYCILKMRHRMDVKQAKLPMVSDL